ncbi:MAG TPA: hypothetical protein VJM83_05650, partial [Nitrospirota bacterium]|nr:hypothetical protein [Nitrospirota bacterium]
MKYFIAAVMAVLIAVPPVTSLAADAPDTVEGMAARVLLRFPRAEGKVVFADGSKVRVDIGSAQGLRPGMEVFLFRPGKPIRHPVTKEIIGTRENALGRIKITSAGEKESEGEVVELLATRILEGDAARLSTEKSRLLIGMPVAAGEDPVADRFLAVLGDSGRFDIIGPEEISGGAAGDALAKAASEKGADAALYLALTPDEKQEQVKVELALYPGAGGPTEKFDGTVSGQSEVYEEKVMDYPLVRGEHRDFYRLEALPYRAKHMAAGKVAGGGTGVVLTDGHGLVVYTIDRDAMRESWREAASKSDTHLSVECADLNGNGRDEIYVTALGPGGLASYVVEHDGSEFRRTAGPEPVFFRVLDMPDGTKKLLTTTIGKDSPYSGIVNEYRWDGGKLVRAGRFELPDKIKDIYGFAIADVIPEKDDKKPVPEIVWVDDSDYVQVLDMGGKRLWKSPERYGGYDNFFEVQNRDLSLPNVDNRGKVKGRVIVRE